MTAGDGGRGARRAGRKAGAGAPAEAHAAATPRSPTALDRYVAIVGFASRVAGVVAACLIALAVLVVCDMVIERYFLNRTTIWQIDVVTYSIVAATFVGSAYVLMLRGHVNVDVLPLHLGPRARYGLALATGVTALGFCAVLWVLCTQYWYQAYSETWRSNTVWRARLWIPYLSMPVGLGLLVLQYVAELLCLVTGRAPPFGIGRGAHAEDAAAAQARQALEEAP
ncbi:MAG TPA: TRAP transporter small permease [Casimicrobiaceae bacterium]|nr:TRAP transporter small permease [Casimicrobiaceae bacterium]